MIAEEGAAPVEKIGRDDTKISGITGGRLSAHVDRAMFAKILTEHLHEINIDGENTIEATAPTYPDNINGDKGIMV
ncbi:MAG: hypothetical protein KKA19_04040 [Candidatus Margulisbacteria bacterium]|nr:hypothetical protein [Candidatus Margulisiibacteriota bacterium]